MYEPKRLRLPSVTRSVPVSGRRSLDTRANDAVTYKAQSDEVKLGFRIRSRFAFGPHRHPPSLGRAIDVVSERPSCSDGWVLQW